MWRVQCIFLWFPYIFIIVDCVGHGEHHGSLLHQEEHVSAANTVAVGDTGSMQKVLFRSSKKKRSIVRMETSSGAHQEGGPVMADTLDDWSSEAEQAQDLYDEEPDEGAELIESNLTSDEESRAGWGDRRRNGCEWKSWTSWQRCAVSCGPGIIKRNRPQDARRRGPSCWSRQWEQRDCQHAMACPVDCVWSSWTSWVPFLCPVACGTGKQVSWRTMATKVSGGGKQCIEPTMWYQEKACNEHHCPIDCNWNAWLPWSDCDKSCGGGSFQRVRVRDRTQEHAGRQCDGPMSMVGVCNAAPCPIDCVVQEWSEWGNCTEDCDSGERTRIKVIEAPQMHGGKACPPIEENGTCNEEACYEAAGIRASPAILTIVALLLTVIMMQDAQHPQDS